MSEYISLSQEIAAEKALPAGYELKVSRKARDYSECSINLVHAATGQSWYLENVSEETISAAIDMMVEHRDEYLARNTVAEAPAAAPKMAAGWSNASQRRNPSPAPRSGYRMDGNAQIWDYS